MMMLQSAIFILVAVGIQALAFAFGLSGVASLLLTGLTLAVAAAVYPLIRKLSARTAKARAAPSGAAEDAEPERIAGAIRSLLRTLERDTGYDACRLHLVFAEPGVDVEALLAEVFRRQERPFPWSVWRRRGDVCLVVPGEWSTDEYSARWRRLVALLPSGRWPLHGFIVAAGIDRDPSRSAASQLLGARMRVLAAHLGQRVPVRVLWVGAERLFLAVAPEPEPGEAGAVVEYDRLAGAFGLLGGSPLPGVAPAPDGEGGAVDEYGRLAGAFGLLGDPPSPWCITPAPDGEALTSEILQLAESTERRLHARLRNASPGQLGALIAAPVFLSDRADALAADTSALVREGPDELALRRIDLVERVVREGKVVRRVGFAQASLESMLRDPSAPRPSPRVLARRGRRRVVAAALVGVGLLGLGLHVVRAALVERGQIRDALAGIRRLAGARQEAWPIRELAEHDRALRSLHATGPAWPTARLGLSIHARLDHAMYEWYGSMVDDTVFRRSFAHVERTLVAQVAAKQAAADTVALLWFYLHATWARDDRGELSSRESSQPAASGDASASASVREVVASMTDASLTREQREALVPLLAEHLERLEQRPALRRARDRALVQQVRALLAERRGHADCTLERLRERFPGERGLPSLLARADRQLYVRGGAKLPELYTAEVFRRVVAELADPARCGPGGWVMGFSEEQSRREGAVRRGRLLDAYADEFIAAWGALHERVRVDLTGVDCRTLATALLRLTGETGALRQLAELVLAQTRALEPAARSELELFGVRLAPEYSEPQRGRMVAALRRYGATFDAPPDPRDGKGPALARLFAAVRPLAELLNRQQSSRVDRAQILGDVEAAVRYALDDVDEPARAVYGRLFGELLARGERCLGGSAPGDPYCAEVVAAFPGDLGYPFQANSRRDASFSALCGLVCRDRGAWKYYDQVLARYLSPRSDGSYAPVAGEGIDSFAHYDPRILQFYRALRRLSDAVAIQRDGRPAIGLAFYVPPVDGDGLDIEKITITVGDQRLEFTNAEERWLPARLPGDGPSDRGASLAIVGRRDGAELTAELSEPGEWGLFRLMERARVVRDGELLRFSFRLPGLDEATIDVLVDAGRADVLFVGRDGEPSAWRSPDLVPPARLFKDGAACPR